MRAARELWSPLPVALALTAAALFAGGGAGNGNLPWLGGAAILAAAAFAAVRGLPPGFPLLLPLAALALWCLASVAWSIEPDRSWDYGNRTLVYFAFALVGAFAAGRTRELALGLAALCGAVCAWSLAGKALPWLYEDYGRIARLRGPVGYWNALALLGDVALPLGLWLAGRRRAAGALLVYGWTVAIALTYSRGGVAVAVVVVAAWLALSGLWLQGLATLVAAGLPAAGAIAVAFSLSGVTSDGASHATRVHDGLLFGAVLLAGAGAAWALSGIPPPEPVPAVRTAAIALAIVAAAAACLVAAFHARTWWDEFTAPAAAEVPNAGSRLAAASSNHRWVWWKEAWRGVEGHPLAGTGAGSFELTNLRYRSSTLDRAEEPHDLPLQFLSETGAVGLALFLLAAAALLRGARRPTDPETALALALPAYLLHGLVDIDWDFAAVSGPVFLVAGALAARAPAAARASFATGLAAAGVALAALGSLLAVWLGARWTDQAFDALGSDPARAVTLAKRARSVQPLSVDPLFAQALAEQLRRRYGETLGLLQEATRLQPENAETWFRLGEFDFRVRNCPRTALPELDRFTALNPQDPGNVEYDRALALVNSGKPVC
ncbi:MAG TPA: O-antigen ligase family protein [Gaiellaceae bacterium]|nr:O-antigen ligase family protein [Gaiellaceae bacterium]